MGDFNYFVATRNIHGQPSTIAFGSKEEFDTHYSSKMQDGSGRLVREVYPEILYQGPDEQACEAAWDSDLQGMISNPARLEDHFRAELPEDFPLDVGVFAERVYEQLNSPKN